MIETDDLGIPYIGAETQKFFVPKKGTKGYVKPDFLENNDTIVEIKSIDSLHKKEVIEKVALLEEWAIANGYKYKLVTPTVIPWKRIKELWSQKLIVFDRRYKYKLEKRLRKMVF